MPTTTSFVKPEQFLEHKGVKVFHTYVDDDIDQGRKRHWYTLDERGDDSPFDVRDPNLDRHAVLAGHPPYLNESDPRYAAASDSERDQFAVAWQTWLREGGTEDQAIRSVLISAIDAGILGMACTSAG